jgi:hypothetical protein
MLTPTAHMGLQPKGHSLPTKADNLNAVLNEVAAGGWELAPAGVINHANSIAVSMRYVWRRASR